jgi:hypothetical protein
MTHRFRNRLGTTFLVGMFCVACGGSEFTGTSGNSQTGAGGNSSGGSSSGGTSNSAGSTDLGGSSGASAGGDGGQTNGAGGADASVDAAAGGTDGGVNDSGLSDSGGLVVTPYDAGGSCPNPTLWYPDGDNDGYGSNSVATKSCTKPPGNFTKTTGDCNDDPQRDGADVHPNQTAYFIKGYLTADGTGVSFDYDCKDGETGDGSQPDAPGCGLFSANCTAQKGYVHTSRTGPGQNPLCGSVQELTCKSVLGILGCQDGSKTSVVAYHCR